MSFTDVHDDDATAEAARGLARVLEDRNLRRAQDGLAARLAEPAEWRRVLGMSDYMLYVTPDELEALDAEILAAVRRFEDRVADAERRPADSKPIQMLWAAYPYEPGER